MGPGPLIIAALLGFAASVHSAANETSICKPPPPWSIGDEEPMRDAMGRVMVVALLQASCGFCLVQAQSMGPLRDKLANQGLSNISYIIVNDQSSLSKALLPELQRRAPPGIPVYQQLPGQEDVWKLLDGNKDDFLIYDRCGRLTFHIRLPLSFLHFRYVEAAINATYYEDYCQNCSFYANVSWSAPIAPTGNISKEKSKDEAINDGKHGGHHRHGEGHRKGHHHPTDGAAANNNGEQDGSHRHRGEGHRKGHRHHHPTGEGAANTNGEQDGSHRHRGEGHRRGHRPPTDDLKDGETSYEGGNRGHHHRGKQRGKGGHRHSSNDREDDQ